MTATPVTGIHYADRGAEMVVALPHVAVVRGALTDLGIDGVVTDRDELLGLGLLDLRGLAAAGYPTVAAVLGVLRARFARDHGGWQPTMGRNRILDHVTGVGEISFGGEGSPLPPTVAAAWAPRGAGPGQGVRVALLDTALYPAPWLAGGWAGRHSDVLAPPLPGAPGLTEISGHSTFIAGLILGQAPGAVVELERVLDEHGQADAWSVAKAIAACGNAGIDVLNLSLVCFTEDGRPPLALAVAVERVASSVVVVAAAGNHGDSAAADPPATDGPGTTPPASGSAATGSAATDSPGAAFPASTRPAWPAALPRVVAVGAAQSSGGAGAGFSPDQPWVDVLAPGVDVVSTYLDGPVRPGNGRAPVQFEGFAQWSGTSFAAALVSGAIAAGVRPGRVGAPESWLDIRSGLDRSRRDRSAPASLPLRLL